MLIFSIRIEIIREASQKRWDKNEKFREREKHSKSGNASKDEKLGISNHLLENNSVNERCRINGKKA